jgi:hypothetical protein
MISSLLLGLFRTATSPIFFPSTIISNTISHSFLDTFNAFSAFASASLAFALAAAVLSCADGFGCGTCGGVTGGDAVEFAASALTLVASGVVQQTPAMPSTVAPATAAMASGAPTEPFIYRGTEGKSRLMTSLSIVPCDWLEAPLLRRVLY